MYILVSSIYIAFVCVLYICVIRLRVCWLHNYVH